MTAAREYRTPGDHVMDAYRGRLDDVAVPLWLNLGEWRGTTTYAQACETLAEHVAACGGFVRGSRVLDVGCGFAEPARYWARRHLARVTCVNNDLFQIGVAERRIGASGLESSVSIVFASATAMDLPAGSFDAVVALESAFQFNTRDEFLQTAFRLLRPGGTIVLADLAARSDHATTDWNRQVRARLRVPEANVCDLDAYGGRVVAAGFESVEIESIRQLVFPAMAKLIGALERREGALATLAIDVPTADMERCSGADLWEQNVGFGDFVLCVGRRP